MKKPDFVEVSGYLRVLEKRLLSQATLNRIAEAASPQEALKLIAQYGTYTFDDPKTYETTLRAAHEELYQMAYRSAPDPLVVDIAACRYAFHNIKVAVKAAIAGTETPAGLSGIFSRHATPQDIVDAAKGTGGEKQLAAYIVDTIAGAKAVYAQTKQPESIAIYTDKCMLAHMLSLCSELHNAFVTRYVQQMIDFYNARALVRSRDMGKGSSFLGTVLAQGGLVETDFFLRGYAKSTSALASAFYYQYFGSKAKKGMEVYERTGNYSELERLFDNMLVDMARQTKYNTYGAQNLFAYIMSKENEIRQVRIIMACKINGISNEALKERLRDNYV